MNVDLNNPFFEAKENPVNFIQAYIVSNRFKDEDDTRTNRWWYHSNIIFDFRRVNRIVTSLEATKVLEVRITRLKFPSFFGEIPLNSKINLHEKIIGFHSI